MQVNVSVALHASWHRFKQIVQRVNGIRKEIGCNIIVVQVHALQLRKPFITEARYFQRVVTLTECIMAISIANAFPEHFGQLLVR